MSDPVDPGARLAAYLAGDLDAEERAEVEAQLAREPSLRARLEAIRETDRRLAALDEVRPRDGFSTRLRATLDDELERTLAGESAGEAPGDVTSLAAERARRQPRYFRPAFAAAAALLIIAGVGVGITVMQGAGDDSAEQTMQAMEPETAADGAEEGPLILATGRSYDETSVRSLLDSDRFDRVLSRELGRTEAGAVAEQYADQFGVPESGDAAGAAPEAEPESLEGADEPAAAAPQLDAATRGSVGDQDLEAVQRCLPDLLETTGAVIPVFAEIASYEGEPAIVYGFVSADAQGDEASRTEIWVVGRDDCQPRFFTQRDR